MCCSANVYDQSNKKKNSRQIAWSRMCHAVISKELTILTEKILGPVLL